MKKILLTFLILLLPTVGFSFPSTSVLDNFNRANSATTLGSNWTTDTILNDAVGITSNTAYHPADSNDAVQHWNVSSFSGNIETYVSVPTVGSGALGVSCWTNNASANGYLVSLNFVDANHVDIYRSDASSYVSLVEYSKTVSNGDSLGMTINNGNITAWYESGSGAWQALGTVKDTTYSCSNIGLYIEGTTSRLDNFGGGLTNGSVNINKANINKVNLN